MSAPASLWSSGRAGADGGIAGAPADGGDPVDPAYPFLHPERTPDVLGEALARLAGGGAR